MRAPSLRHPSLRFKLTLAFAAAMALLLTALGTYIYASFQKSLDQSLNQGLRSRTSDVRALVNQADTGLADAGGARLGRTETGFAQVLLPNGSVVDQTPGLPRRAVLSARELARASRRPIFVTAEIPGAPGPVRVLATPVRAQDRSLLVIVAASLQNRAAALNDLRALMLLGGPVALVLASLLGYGVSALSLRSVEAMRRQAKRMSVAEPGRRLEIPSAHDEMQRLALTLNEMLDRNDAAFAQERRFIADASHELRSPLAILKMELEDALSGDKSERELRSALASADSETDRISQLARDLLTLAQAEEGRLRVEPAALRVDVLLERLRQRFARRASLEGRDVVASVPAQITLHADPLRVEQALSNLLDNALRHGAGTIVLSAHRHDGLVDLRVSDSGPGFPEGYLKVAFERFSRADLGRTSEGAGLGLSIVSSIARAHGGDAHVANRSGEGAEAWITLPQTADVRRPNAPTSPTSPRRARRRSRRPARTVTGDG
ncbi:MAG TPA: ATP-binding protein [Solirubrobacteraceae bacterium]|jgi:signal transduction histidine kinase|nr:ATP-binding protein [Solirubrobacteraceae bacterium]